MAWSKITAVRLFVLAVCLLNAFSDAAVKKTRKRVVCYYTNWSVYRQGLAKFLPNNINPHLCTHLIYAFGGFNDDFELQPFDKYQDIEKGGYARFNGLKQYNKGMRTLLALGGWNEGSGRFSELVADAEYRKRFAYSAIRYLRQYNFDGLDLDWEYPGSRAGSDPSDKENYATLCEELRAVFEAESIKTNRPVLLLTVAVPAGISTIENGFNVPRLNAVVDFFNILAYDYHASSEPLTDHHAPLMALPGASEYDYRTELNVDYTVRFYLKSGAERRKLVVGIPTYGRSYTLIDGQFNGLQAAAESPGLKGKYTKEDGYLSFYEVCEMVAVDEWQVYRPYPELMGPYATKDRQWVGYDDEFAAAKKAEYVRDNRLGGIMFWSVDNDDFRGRCSGQPYPLIEAAKKAYLSPIPGSPPKQQKGPTPAPPPTPDPGADFECKREGFYPHPNECNKYFWCLSGGALGLVPHRFTCPTGLLFNRNTDACDFPRSVKCKVAEKKVESITFPPTPEPIITRTPAVIGSTENPFDDYYEEYDTGSLPELDLDFPDLSDDLFTPAKTTPTVEVLGGSRGGASAIQTSSFSLSSPEEDSEESDPAELKQLLSLIQNLGGVEGVQRLLQGESSSSFISEKERKALTKIVDKQQGLQRTRPEAVNSNSLRSRTRGSSQSSTSSNTRSQPRPSSSSSNRGRNPQEGAFGDSALTDSVANTRTNTRRRPATSSSESRRQTAGVNRRRPQYTSIQRDRSPQRGQSVVVEENEGFEEPQLANVQISRPTIVNDFRATNDQSRRQQTIGSSDSRRQYLTLERGRGESGRQELTDASLAEFGGVEDEAIRAAFQTGRISPQRTRNRGGITIRRPGNRAPQIFRLTSTLPPRLTSTTTTTPAPPPPTTTTNPPTTEEAFAQYSSTSPAITTRRLPSLRRRPLSSGAGSRGSSRDRLRQRLQSSRTSPNSLSSNRVQTTTSADPSDFFTQSEAPFTTSTETAPTPSTAGRLVSRSTIGQARTSAPANLFQTIATTPATTTASRSFPFPSAGQQLNGDADSDDYDYYYDYFFEYPDGTVVEIPEDQLDDLQSEIAAAKKALLESERSTGSLREDRKIDTTAFISSTASPRFLNSVTTSSSLQNFEIPQGYEVTEYAVPIAGNRHEDVVIFEDETGQRVISTTYRPIVNKATETNKIEDSTLRQFLGEIEGTTKSTIVNRKNDASRPNDFRNDARSFSNFRKANRFDDGRIPANTFAKTNKPARGSFRQRTRAGSDRGQSTEEREGKKPVSSVPNLSIITRGQQGRIRTGSSIAPTEPSTDTISQTRTPFLNGRFVPTVEFLNALEQRRASTTTIRIPSPKTERTTTTTTTTTTEKPTPATFRPFRTPFQPIVRTTESPRSDAATENLDSITDVTRTSFFRQPSSRNTFRTDVGKARISSNGASGIEDRTTEALPVDQVIPNEAKTEVPSVVKQESTRGRNRFRGGFRSDRVRAAARNRQRPRTSSRPSTSSRRRNRVRGGTVVRIAGDRTGTKSADDRETVDQGVRERQTTTTATTTTTTTVTTTTTATTTTTTTTTTQVPIRSRVRGRNSRLLATRTRDRNANSRRRTVRKKAILRFIEPTTTSSPNIAEFEPAAVITTRSTVTRIPRINNPHDDMDEVEKEQFKKFLDDTDADLRRLNGQQLRDLFSQTIKKTAVFVRRKPGSAAPEIIGHGTVISQPGGERRVIVQNRPTSEITLIDSSTISSILRTTPAPRLRISPKPFSNERQALGTERTPLSLPRLGGSGRFFSSSDSNEPQQDLSVEGYSGVLTTESPQLNDVSNSFVSVDPFSHAPSRNNFFSNDEAHILPTRSTVSGNRADARTTNGAANEKKLFEQGPWRGVTSPTFDNADRQRLQATRQRQREPVDEVITASRAWLTGGENDPVENPGGSFLTQRSLITRTASPEDSRLAEEEDRLRLQRIATIVNDIKQDQASANKVEEPEPIKAPSGGRRTLIVHGQSNRKPHTTTFLAPRLNENNTSEAVASNNEGADGRDGETYGAIIDANDQVTCYGVGTFAHPSSSKKFIHCSSPRAGRVAGTVFLCPQGLQFDSRALTCSFVR